MKTVSILGNGLAALTCARLLVQQQWAVSLYTAPRPAAPVLVLNDATCDLLQSLWHLPSGFWNQFPLVRTRRVIWGDRPPSLALHPSAIVPGQTLVAALQTQLEQEGGDRLTWYLCASMAEACDRLQTTTSPTAWHIDGSGRQAHWVTTTGRGTRQPCGQRVMLNWTVALPDALDGCILESSAAGWLFLLPTAPHQGVLQVMVMDAQAPLPSLEAVLASSRVIARYIGQPLSAPAAFAAAPQGLDPVGGDRWFALGEAALTVDPISGEGTGYALRSALWVASVLVSIEAGLDPAVGTQLYSDRLHRTLSAHLEQCLALYRELPTSLVLYRELETMTVQQQRLRAIAADAPALNYQLIDRRLVKTA